MVLSVKVSVLMYGCALLSYSVKTMDAIAITTYLQDKKTEYTRFHSRQLLQALHVKKYVDIESKKDELFNAKVDFVSMSKSLREVMVRETGYRQLKKFFVEMIDMTDEEATHAADKYNEGSRIYDKFPMIIENLSKCPNLDIRDLTIHELALAKKPSWVLRRSAVVANKKKPSGNGAVGAEVDWDNVQQSVDMITSSDWYEEAKDNPPLVAYIMDKVNDRVIGKSMYTAQG